MDKEKKPIIIETADIYLHFPYIMKEEADNLADFLEEEHIEYEGATDIFIDLQNQVKKQKEVIDKAIKYYEANQQECVIGRNKDDKLIKEYYLPAQCSNELLDILKEVK
nr:MAG TPA: hypothetical protein [Caudoviricetes sp.]